MIDPSVNEKTDFTVKQQWKFFMQRAGFKPGELPVVQEIEMSKAFYGASGQILLLLRDELSDLPEKDGMVKLQSMINEIGTFFQEKQREYDEHQNKKG